MVACSVTTALDPVCPQVPFAPPPTHSSSSMRTVPCADKQRTRCRLGRLGIQERRQASYIKQPTLKRAVAEAWTPYTGMDSHSHSLDLQTDLGVRLNLTSLQMRSRGKWLSQGRAKVSPFMFLY